MSFFLLLCFCFFFSFLGPAFVALCTTEISRSHVHELMRVSVLLKYTSIFSSFFFAVLLFYKVRYDYSTTTTVAAATATTPKCIRNVICVCVCLAV